MSTESVAKAFLLRTKLECVDLTPQAIALVDRLVGTGLFGISRGACLTELVNRQLREIMREPWWHDGPGSAKPVRAIADEADAAVQEGLAEIEKAAAAAIRGPTEREDAPVPKYHTRREPEPIEVKVPPKLEQRVTRPPKLERFADEDQAIAALVNLGFTKARALECVARSVASWPLTTPPTLRTVEGLVNAALRQSDASKHIVSPAGESKWRLGDPGLPSAEACEKFASLPAGSVTVAPADDQPMLEKGLVKVRVDEAAWHARGAPLKGRVRPCGCAGFGRHRRTCRNSGGDGPNENPEALEKAMAPVVPNRFAMADKIDAGARAAAEAKGPCKGCGGPLGASNKSGWCSGNPCKNRRPSRPLEELAAEEDKPTATLNAELERQAAELKASPEGLRGPPARSEPRPATETPASPGEGTCAHGRPRASCLEHPTVAKSLMSSDWTLWHKGLIVARYAEKAAAEKAALTWAPAVKAERPVRV